MQKKAFKVFEQRLKTFKSVEIKLKKSNNNISVLRVALFLVFLSIGLYALQAENMFLFLTSIVVFVFIFGIILNYHRKIRKNLKLTSVLAGINEDELKRMHWDIHGFDGGEEFMEENHPYSYDIDIFGRGSLFQLIVRTGSFFGRKLLADWLASPSMEQSVINRQKAIYELHDDIDWQQLLHAYSILDKTKEKDTKLLHSWFDDQDQVRNNSFLIRTSKIMPVVSVIMIVLLALGIITYHYFILLLFFNGFVLSKTMKYAKSTHDRTGRNVKVLHALVKSIKHIEGREFESELLLELKKAFTEDRQCASEKINALAKMLSWLDLRGNQFYWLFNSLFLLDVYILCRAERWRAENHEYVFRWFRALGKFEALNSLTGFHYSNPDFTWPKLIAGAPSFRAEKLGHPLIREEDRVVNDIVLEGTGTVCIITGSNMSGKSTFLRTIGINAVLAYAGAPVCANKLSLSSFNVFTSMRTKDNLDENISSFYAELLRLKQLLENINKDKPVLFLLDEILKGTNSADRHLGAQALARQLIGSNSFGMISTHDLELGRMEKEEKKIINYSFNSKIEGEEIIFDYKLHEGICRSTNASQLMAKIGIKIT